MTSSHAAQTVGDLRTLVARRAGTKQKVALLANDTGLRAALEQNGCTVLVDPEGLDALAAFNPEVIVAFDGFLSERGQSLLLLAQVVPRATVVLSFSNSAAATMLLQALTGHSPAPGFSEHEVTEWLSAAGYVVQAKDVVIAPHLASGLSADTEAALRQLFEQLNPSAGADRLLVTARRGAVASKPLQVPGLVSVIVSGGDDAAALQGTLASLAVQTRTPYEVVVAAALPLERLDQAMSKLRGRAHVTTFNVTTQSTDWAARSNAALDAATGQYVTFAEAGDLFDPRHLERLAAQLQPSTAAWALSSPGDAAPGPFRLADWLARGHTNRSRWLIDRSRLGAFALSFAEGSELAEAMLFTRLALLFVPSWVPGPITVDSPRASVGQADALLAQLHGRPLRTLASLESLFEKPELASLLEERLEALRPGVGRNLGKALSWWKALPLEKPKREGK